MLNARTIFGNLGIMSIFLLNIIPSSSYSKNILSLNAKCLNWQIFDISIVSGKITKIHVTDVKYWTLKKLRNGVFAKYNGNKMKLKHETRYVKKYISEISSNKNIFLIRVSFRYPKNLFRYFRETLYRKKSKHNVYEYIINENINNVSIRSISNGKYNLSIAVVKFGDSYLYNINYICENLKGA